MMRGTMNSKGSEGALPCVLFCQWFVVILIAKSVEMIKEDNLGDAKFT